MQTSTFLFVHPDYDRYPSGGNHFNRRMVLLALERGWSLRSVPVDLPRQGDPEHGPFSNVIMAYRSKPASLILWDSLYLTGSAAPPLAEARHALLLHFLPSLNPMLNASEAAAARHAEDRWISRMDFLITSGSGVAKLVADRYPGVRVYCCEPGVDVAFRRVRDCVRRASPAFVRLLSVGNLTAAKGYRELLAAISALESGGWCWQIVGSDRLDARFAEEFERSAAEWITSGQIRRLSISCPIELAGLMERVDLFVAASHFESYGMALAEAVTAGLPVVTTDVGDAALITRFARSTWLVPVGDKPALQVALRSAVAAHRQGWRCPAAREDIPVRTWEQVFTRVQAICETEAVRHAAGYSDDFE